MTGDDEAVSLVARQMQQLQEQQKDLEYREQLLRDQQTQLANSIGQQQQGLRQQILFAFTVFRGGGHY